MSTERPTGIDRSPATTPAPASALHHPRNDPIAMNMLAARISDTQAIAYGRRVSITLAFLQAVRELQGARDVTYNEVARIVGAAIGKPDLVYQQAPADSLKPV